MEALKVDQLIQKSGSKFPASKLNEIKQKLEQASDSKFDPLTKTAYKSSGFMVAMALIFPGFGIDRFNTGSIGLGLLRIVLFIVYGFLFMALSRYDDIATPLTLFIPWSTFFLYLAASITFSVGSLGYIALFGGLAIFIWYASELFTASGRTKKWNYRKLDQILARQG